jgi:hypothetical protein
MPNAAYLKNSQPLSVSFAWRRINLASSDTLKLELAWDRNFTQGLRVYENLAANAQADVDIGVWHWRLSFKDTVLKTGQFTAADASAPALLSPVTGSVFRYHDESPRIRFQWESRSGVSYYILEVSRTSDFFNPYINRQVESNSFMSSELGDGTWYWRVYPVFSSAYIGTSDSSYTGYFTIERTNDAAAAVIEIPDTPAAVLPAVVPPVLPAAARTPSAALSAAAIPVPAAASSAREVSVPSAAVSVPVAAPASSEVPAPAAPSAAEVSAPAAAVPSAAPSVVPGGASYAAASSPAARNRTSSVRRYARAEEGAVVQHVRPQVRAGSVQSAASQPERPSSRQQTAERHYTVRPGDTLASISWEHYGHHLMILRIVEVNNIPNLDLIYPDQVLLIP